LDSTVTLLVFGDPAVILDRHALRRATGIPTVSMLIGPIGASGRTWRRWVDSTGRSVVRANRDVFPCAEWVRAIVERVDVPVAAVHRLARRAERNTEEFLAAWRTKTPADRERFWTTLAPEADDDLLRAVAILAVGGGLPGAVATSLNDLGERIVPVITRLAPSAMWPGVFFVAGSADDCSSIGRVAAEWAIRVPALPIAVAVPTGVWDQYVTSAGESRIKALLREGEIAIQAIDAATVEQALTQAGAVGSALAAITAIGADATLLESAVEMVRATDIPPTTQADDDRARSAAERFLFTFLESLPDTAGRFELNGTLYFRFGTRLAEVDLLCRSPRVAIELDGYFHFLAPDDYRRDRAKDWELQRRGFVVLRFLAEDVIPELEMIRDRILDALTITPPGAQP
jgi:very-short-patch-repair endonuclease